MESGLKTYFQKFFVVTSAREAVSLTDDLHLFLLSSAVASPVFSAPISTGPLRSSPTFSRSSLGTSQPSLPEKQVGQRIRKASFIFSLFFLSSISGPLLSSQSLQQTTGYDCFLSLLPHSLLTRSLNRFWCNTLLSSLWSLSAPAS